MCTPFLTASGKLASAADGMSSCNFCVASSDAYFDHGCAFCDSEKTHFRNNFKNIENSNGT